MTLWEDDEVSEELQHSVNSILCDLSSVSDVRELLAELNYDITHDQLPTMDWGKTASEHISDNPRVLARHGDFQIIYCRLDTDGLYKSHERAVIKKLVQEHEYALFVFSNDAQSLWHFVNVKYERDPERRRVFRRMAVGQGDRLHTVSKRMALLDLDRIGDIESGIAPIDIQEAHDRAFDVEEVTEAFFEDYKEVFWDFQDDLEEFSDDKRWAHDYAQLFLNRLMFLYFIQRKGWLSGDRNFLATLWKTYTKSDRPEDTFVEEWLHCLFFEALNNNNNLLNSNKRKYLPDEIRRVLHEAPYLNGGLFRRQDDDRKYPDVSISDAQFERIFNFLEGYNFTIDEGSPIDQEVAVDPEMIGKVYESLVNLSSEADERGDAGIFYTPRTEIDLMCRLSLVDNIANHIGEEHKDELYEVIFAIDPDECREADRRLAEKGLWPEVEERLNSTTVVDPACGSGSFLVGMLRILDNLLRRAAEAQGHEPEDSYDRRKEIIRRSLYGVDVMEWASRVAELRLWLALVVEADMTQAELQIRKDPLLPNFSFNIRCGDSLVQEVEGVNLHQKSDQYAPSHGLKVRLGQLQKAKRDFYNNMPGRRFKTDTKIKEEELRLFRDILEERAEKLGNEAKRLMRQNAQETAQQTTLTGGKKPESKQLTLDREKREKRIKQLKEEQEQVQDARKRIKGVAELPFVWDVAFAEIMDSEAGGFDIVIGNPPYVRQENIAPPYMDSDEVTRKAKKQYKMKLERAAFQSWDAFFGYRPARDKGDNPRKASDRNLSRRSDLYIYFYFVGLSLVGDNGIFCFITSNSWLDVGYGADLQEFLLEHCHVRKIIDNEVQRSFKSADVNTVISVLEPLDGAKLAGLDRTARFVMMKLPFEQLKCPSVAFEEIELADSRDEKPEYRVRPVEQRELLEESWEWPEDASQEKIQNYSFNIGKYKANKWGGKYLRAPDIYWNLVKKRADMFLRLGEVASVQRGFTTGANEFFYLDQITIDEWNIEEEYVHPILKGSSNCQSYRLEKKDLDTYVLLCGHEKENLRGTNVLRYIEWGEAQGFSNRRTCASREPWYDLGIDNLPKLFLPKGCWRRHFACISDERLLYDQQIYGVYCRNNPTKVWASLNATQTVMFAELYGRCNFGEGILWLATYEWENIPIINPSLLGSCSKIAKLNDRPIQNISREIRNSRRRDADKILWDTIGLSQNEREAIYQSSINLLETRRSKSESI